MCGAAHARRTRAARGALRVRAACGARHTRGTLGGARAARARGIRAVVVVRT